MQISRFYTLVLLLLICTSSARSQDTQDEIDVYMKRIVEKAITTENIIINHGNRLNYLQLMLQDELGDMKKLGSKEDIATLKTRLAHIRQLNKQAKKLSKRANEAVSILIDYSEKSPEKISENLEKIKFKSQDVSEVNQMMLQLIGQIDQVGQPLAEPAKEDEYEIGHNKELHSDTDVPQDTTQTTSEPVQSSQTKVYAKYSIEQDVILHPPSYKCTETQEDIDPFNGKARKITQSEELFHFTNAFMANSLKDKQHITCHAALIKSEKKTFLHLKFVINDRNGSQNFGAIKQNVPIMIKFVDGSNVILQNSLSDDGQTDLSGEIYTVSAMAEMSKESRERLKTNLIDRLRVPWVKGFEEYEIYRVDLIQELLKCL
jgi:hypothetical protein